jgi:bifunctional N-acetylglutamate synthase/kinase
MLREILMNLLHNLGGRAEVDRYLREHTGEGRFAVIKVGGGLIHNDLDELASAIVFMHHVGLNPVVVHGAGPQLSAELEANAINPEFIDGLRVTTPQVLNAAQRVFQRVGALLADAIDERGVTARPINMGVFSARQTPHKYLGHVGEITNVLTESIEHACRMSQIPIVSPVATNVHGQLLNINADTATRALAIELKATKIIYLTPTGGILDPEGQVIPAVNCSEDLDPMLKNEVISGGMARKLFEINELLEQLDVHASVSITAPAKIARELFTHCGSGTLVRKGRPITVQTGTHGLDSELIVALLEQSFGRTLQPEYIDTLENAKIYIGGDYAAIAIIKERATGWYLDKLGLSERAQGIGLGASLWNRLTLDHPSLYWRSRPNNPANKWYLSRADGMQRSGDWIVFWYGIDSRDTIYASVNDAIEQPHAFTPGPDIAPEPSTTKEHAYAG